VARVTVDLPERFAFSTELALYAEHINYAQHLDNARLLGLVSEARVRWLASLEYQEGDVEGVGLIMADQSVRYASEARAGEVMVVSMCAGEIGRVGFEVVWVMHEQASGREVARGRHNMVCFDYANARVRPVPDRARVRLAGAA
jgi:4-hydroxybenzoyl-CoA thioesterase